MTDQEIVQLLQRAEVFGALSPDMLTEFIGDCGYRLLAPGETLFVAGSQGNEAYFVLDGTIEIFLGTRVITRLEVGDYFGELAIVDPCPRSASVRAAGSCMLLEIDKLVFDKYIAANAQALYALLRYEAKALRRLTERTQIAYDEVRMAVHDIRNLMGAYDLISMVAHNLPEDSRDRHLLEHAVRTRDDMAVIISTVLGRSRGASPPCQKQSVNLAQLLRETVEQDLALHEDVRKVRLELELPPDVETVPCHPTDIKRVATNLIINAAQASPAGKCIRVRLWQDDSSSNIAVADEAGGIPESAQPHIFRLNFTTKTEGNGLGLASCRKIIEEEHGGRIFFETLTGKGTTFICQIPRARS